MKNIQSRNPVIDLFRAFACLWVIATHAPLPQSTPSLLADFISIGWLGVNLFFVISGFLIFSMLAEDKKNSRSYRLFYIRRAFKIFPQYFCLILVVYLFCQLSYVDIPAGAHFWQYFLFIQNYYPSIWPLAHTWSLCVEEYFYISLPILLLIAQYGKSKTPKLTLRQWQVVTLLIPILICAVSRFIYFRPFIPDGMTTMTQFNIGGIYYGCLFFCLLSTKIFTSRHLRPLSYLILFVLAGYTYWLLDQNTLRAHRIGWYLFDYVQICLGILVSLAYTSKLLEFICSKLPRLLSIGRYSYGIYVWHFPIVLILRNDVFASQTPWLQWLNFGSCFALSIFIGYLSTIFLENYFLKIRSKYFGSDTVPLVSNADIAKLAPNQI
jgi:peptidoglycan/LPS O-acetylase OafA/YrhL